MEAQFDDFDFMPGGLADVRREVIATATETATRAELDAVQESMAALRAELDAAGRDGYALCHALDNDIMALWLATMHAAGRIGADVADAIPASKADALRRIGRAA